MSFSTGEREHTDHSFVIAIALVLVSFLALHLALYI